MHSPPVYFTRLDLIYFFLPDSLGVSSSRFHVLCSTLLEGRARRFDVLVLEGGGGGCSVYEGYTQPAMLSPWGLQLPLYFIITPSQISMEKGLPLFVPLYSFSHYTHEPACRLTTMASLLRGQGHCDNIGLGV